MCAAGWAAEEADLVLVLAIRFISTGGGDVARFLLRDKVRGDWEQGSGAFGQALRLSDEFWAGETPAPRFTNAW